MELIIKVSAAAIVCICVCALLKRTQPELAVLLVLALTGTAALLSVDVLEKVMTVFRRLIVQTQLSPAYASIVLKTVGIALTAKLTGALCADAGQQAAASAVELAGCCAALYIAMPLVESILEMIGELT